MFAQLNDPRNEQHAGSVTIPTREQAAPSPEIAQDEAIVVSRSKLVQGVPTGESMRHNKMIRESPAKWLGLPIEDRRRLETGEDVMIQPEVVRKTTTFLTNYVERWNDLAKLPAPNMGPNTAPNMLEHLLRDPAYLADKALLDRLSKPISPNLRETVSAEEMRQFLTSSESWGEVMLAIERFTLLAEMGNGIETTVKHKLYNRQPDDSMSHRKIEWENDLKTLRGMIKSGVSRSLTTVGALAYALGGGSGETDFDIRYRAAIVDALKQPPDPADPENFGMSVEDRAVLFAFTGVDMDNLGVNRNRIEPLNDSSTYAEDIRLDVAAAYALRKDVMVTLGLGEPATHGWFTKHKAVNRAGSVRTLHEFIYLYAQGYERDQGGRRPEGLRFVTDVRVMQEYTRLCRTVGGTLTEMQRLQFMGDAITHVRNRYAQDRLEVEMSQRQEQQADDSLDALDAKRTAMDSGEFRKERADRALDRKNKAKTAGEGAEARRTSLREAEGSVGKADEKVQNLASILSRMGVDTAGDIEAAFQTRVVGLQVDITAQTGILNGRLNLRQVQQQAAVTAARVAYNAMVAGLPAATKSVPPFDGGVADKDAVTERWQPIIEADQAELNRLTQELTNLRTRYEEYRTAADGQFEATLSLAYADGERNKLENAVNARTTLTASVVTLPGAAGAAALTPADITDRSAQVLVDALRGAAPPIGADDAERLRWVLQAKAQVQQDNAPLPVYQQDAVNRLENLPAPNNFSRDVLMIRDPNEVINVLRELYEAGGLPDDPLVPLGPFLAALPPADALARARTEVLSARIGVSRQLRELVDARLTA
jgi:hypothetical protein